jgi:hypothetical protein
MSHKQCIACAHPDAGAINSCIEGGLALKEIAEQFSVSKYALSRHRNRCLATAPTGDDPGDQIEMWLRRCDDLYIQSGVNGDTRGQIAALSAAVRSLQSEQRCEKRQEQNENQNTPVGADSPERLDEIISRYLESCGDDRCYRCGAPTVAGKFTGELMPGTFPALVRELQGTQ